MNEPLIEVGIILCAEEIDFSLKGNFVHQNSFYSGCFKVRYFDGKIHFGRQLYEKIIFTPEDSDSLFELHGVSIGVGFHWERKENQQFKGALKLIAIDGGIAAVNVIFAEHYLASVISSEMAATSSKELLKTHAIISRSWLLKPLFNHRKHIQSSTQVASGQLIRWYERDVHLHFDICADDHCQRYQGITRIAGSSAVTEALSETRGMVLKYENEICDARYYKCCGGATEQFSTCWEDVDFPYLTPVYDTNIRVDEAPPDLVEENCARQWIESSPVAFCNTNNLAILKQVLNDYDHETADFFRWKLVYDQKDLSSLIKTRSGIDFGEIIDLIPLERGPSGRIFKLKIVGSAKEFVVGKELEIRKWLSQSHLYSSAFVVNKKTNIADKTTVFELVGAGWGHGVGLCQIGAAVMSEQGYKYNEILKHYFKNGEVEKIY